MVWVDMFVWICLWLDMFMEVPPYLVTTRGQVLSSSLFHDPLLIASYVTSDDVTSNDIYVKQ